MPESTAPSGATPPPDGPVSPDAPATAPDAAPGGPPEAPPEAPPEVPAEVAGTPDLPAAPEPLPPVAPPTTPAEPPVVAPLPLDSIVPAPQAPVVPPATPAFPPAAPEPPEPPAPVAPPVDPPAPPVEPPPVEPPPVEPPPVEPPPPATPAEPPVPAPPAEPTAMLDAGLAAAAATTTELARPPAVPGLEPADVPDPEALADEAPPRSRRAVAAAVALLVLAGLALVAVRPVLAWRAADRLGHRRDDALADARRLALNIGSIDYKNLDRDLKRISDSTTGKARTEFDAKILKNDAYKTLVKENQAVLTSTIQRIGLQPCGADDNVCKRGDTAVVLVFLDQESKNKLRPTPRVDRNRVALTLVRRDRTWLIAEVAVL